MVVVVLWKDEGDAKLNVKEMWRWRWRFSKRFWCFAKTPLGSTVGQEDQQYRCDPHHESRHLSPYYYYQQLGQEDCSSFISGCLCMVDVLNFSCCFDF